MPLPKHTPSANYHWEENDRPNHRRMVSVFPASPLNGNVEVHLADFDYGRRGGENASWPFDLKTARAFAKSILLACDAVEEALENAGKQYVLLMWNGAADPMTQVYDKVFETKSAALREAEDVIHNADHPWHGWDIMDLKEVTSG